jgi:hypothetical protein
MAATTTRPAPAPRRNTSEPEIDDLLTRAER